jgi:hypothetical protein
MNLLPIKLLVNEKIIQETLTRIGIANTSKMIIYPSCYIYNIEDVWYLMHFKQLFFMINKNGYDDATDEDMARRDAIAFCLSVWELIDVDSELIRNHNKYVYVVPYSEKGKWKINHKININKLRLGLL